MALNKLTYVDHVTVIPASNLNEMQDCIEANETASTSAKTEVEDIRTGADGTVYSSAGDAVRGQIDILQSELDDLYTYTVIDFAWEQGSISSTSGGPIASTTRIRTAYKQIIGDGLKVTVPSGFKMIAYIYATASVTTFEGRYGDGWFTNDFLIVGASNKYVRLVCAYSDDATIVPSDNTQTVITSYALSVADDVAKSVKLSSYDGGTLLANQTSNTIVRIASIEAITDVPKDLIGINRYAWLITSGSVNKIQILWISAYQKQYVRYYTSSNDTWTVWLTADDGKIPSYVAIGASTTVGAIHHFDGEPTTYDSKYNYPTYVGDVLHLHTHNLGVGTTGFIARGTNGTSKNFMDVIYTNDTILSTAKLVTIVFGYGNDRVAGLPIGAYDDYYPYDEEGYHPSGSAGITTMLSKGATLMGCLNWCIKWLGEHYPKAQLILVCGAPSANNNRTVTLTAQSEGSGVAPYKLSFAVGPDYQNTLSREVALLKDVLNIPIIDLFNGDGNIFTYYQTMATNSDGTYAIFSTTGTADNPTWNSHPNSIGYEMYARYVAGLIIRQFKH